MGARFDLSKAIATWRQFHARRHRFLDEDLDELEVHLRAHMAELRQKGFSQEEAFSEAVQSLGDLEEAEAEYRKVYWSKVKREHLFKHEFIWRLSMIKNYVTVALRQMHRQKLYTFINVFGLSVSMACCLLIGLFVRDELSFDRFHEKTDRLYLVTEVGPRHVSLATPYSLASVLESDVPGIVRTTRVLGGDVLPVRREGTMEQTDRRLLFAEPMFFEMFTFPTLAGDPIATLDTPDGVILTKSSARLLFGAENPIGQQVSFRLLQDEIQHFTVGAIVRDPPATSSLRFDVIAPVASLGPMMLKENQWGFSPFDTYVETNSVVPAPALTKRIAGIMPHHLGTESEVLYEAHPMVWQHLSGLRADGLTGQKKYLYMFGSVALLVLLIACVNYVNLVTAQSLQRIREVGVRKTLGAQHAQVATQFLGESLLLCVTALGLACLLTIVVLPFFNALFDKHMTTGYLFTGITLPTLCLVLLVSTVAASIYPALYLARFQPMVVLRGASSTMAPHSGRRLQQSLIVLQFVISAVLLIATTIIYRQMDYVRHADLGFDGDQVIVVDLPQKMTDTSRETLKQSVAAYHGARSVSLANGMPGRFQVGYTIPVFNSAPDAPTTEETIHYRPSVVDFDYIRTFGLHLLAGRDFSPAFPTDVSTAYILNETAVKRLGWSPTEAVGKAFKLGASEVPEGQIIGVVEDFHIATFRDQIVPVVLQMHRLGAVGGLPFGLSAKLEAGSIPESVAFIEAQFKALAPTASFTYTFADDIFDQMYRSEERLSRVITVSAALAVMLACLGLFGLVAFTVKRRTKEIGVRKVLGATVSNIVVLLSREFLVLATLAFFVATPLAYLFMHQWLSDFAYRIAVGPGTFLIAGAMVVLTVFVTIAYQALHAALEDPIVSLRYE